MSAFKGLLLSQEGKAVRGEITALSDDRLPEGDTIVDVAYSTLNYKDAMILNGLGRLVRDYPHVPGIDFVGTVAETSHPGLAPGDAVILTGWRVGEIRWGGYAQRARVKGDWLVPLPQGMTPQRAMAVGTAGLTAMLAIMRLEEHGLTPACGRPVLVTGASGGLGSVAISVLSHLGYAVAAVTGSAAQHDYLKGLGATQIVDRAALETPSGKPLNAETWAGAVDTVGGKILSNLVTELAYGGSVACCGNAGGIDLSTNVLPLLLRGVNLLGIDSVMCPIPTRRVAWERLSRELEPSRQDAMIRVVGLGDLPELSQLMLKGQIHGRIVVDLNA